MDSHTWPETIEGGSESYKLRVTVDCIAKDGLEYRAEGRPELLCHVPMSGSISASGEGGKKAHCIGYINSLFPCR